MRDTKTLSVLVGMLGPKTPMSSIRAHWAILGGGVPPKFTLDRGNVPLSLADFV
jgi:hypothetical protein